MTEWQPIETAPSSPLRCGCGQIATVELNFPAVDAFKGRGPVWHPYCDDCYREYVENAEDTNRGEMEMHGGAYGLVQWNVREIQPEETHLKPSV